MLSRTLMAMLLAFAALSPAAADNWPSRPVTFVVPFPAGGPADGAARIIAKELSEQLKQQFVVENRGGGGGNIGAATVAAANPDGYTLLFATPGPGAMNKLIYRKLPFDPAKDFSPVVLVANIPQLIVASPKLQASDLKQLVAYGKAHPGKLNVGNPGLGTFGHIAAVLFAQRTGLEVTHVPYRGVGPLLTDVMGGQIDFAFAGFVPSITSMKVLAVTATERIRALPNVPTVIETGVADVVSGTWYGILAPAGTPRPVIDKVNRAVNAFVKSERAKKFGDPAGMLMQGGSPEDMAAYIAAEMKLWGPVIRAAKIHID